MVAASNAQSKKLAPLVGYFERKRRDREEKDVADKRWGAIVGVVCVSEICFPCRARHNFDAIFSPVSSVSL